MKISPNTLKLLKNFATINGNIALLEGNLLKTISPQRNVLASVTLAEEFPVNFYIYDLSQFLGVLSLFVDPDIEFTDNVATISEDKRSIRYHAADKSILLLPSDKTIKFPQADVEFDMSADLLAAIHKTAAVLSAPDMSVIGDGKTLTLCVTDVKNPSANDFRAEIGETSKTFTANIAITNLKMQLQSYRVGLSTQKISRWQSTSAENDMQLYVSLESNSVFS